MQENSASLGAQMPKMGHQRHPSIGKSMPVTSLVLNFPSPPSHSKNYHSLSRDGLSPDFEKPPMFFQLKDSTVSRPDDICRVSQQCDINIPAVSQNVHSPVVESNDSLNATDESVGIHKCTAEDTIPSETEINKVNNNRLNSCSKFKSRESSPIPQIGFCPEECGSDQCKDSVKKDLEDIASTDDENTTIRFRPKTASSQIDRKRREFLNDLLNAASSDEDSNSEELRAEEFTMKDFREKFALAEALAKTSMMTSPAAKSRLAARKIEMELDGGEFEAAAGEDEKEFIPPRQLLLYLVRMGSFNSAPKINNPDSQDDSIEVPHGLSTTGLMQYCRMMRGENRPPLLNRQFLKPVENKEAVLSNDITAGLRVLKLNAVSKVCSAPITSSNQLRLLQWNILSQCLGQNNDGFVKCPEEALTWENRKYLIVEEIVRNNPDVVCLQEVDHFKFLERMLGSQNYNGIFFPKPDSPCLYIQDNNGPDGCAIFYKRDKFELINFDTRVLEVWRVQSNQVAIVANLLINESGKEICICTTHLKARNGALLSKLRNEQGKDLLRFVNAMAQGRPVIISGDFNAEPIEPIYSTVLSYKALGLSSAYADLNIKEKTNASKQCNGNATTNENSESDGGSKEDLSLAELSANSEPPYTTWKIREEGEVCHTIDYIFYSKKHLKVNNCLQFPSENEIGVNRTPSFQYPSDHFSLMCDLEFTDNSNDLIS